MTTEHPTSSGYDLWPADPLDPEVRPVPQRLVRSAAAKLRIVQEYESYPAGDPRRGALLRRQGIYTSHISKWRKLRDRAALQALTPLPPGPPPAATDPLQQELARLRTENAHLQARLTQLLSDLGVTKSYSRPSVSDDNPFSEAQFKTAKYHPTYPDRFGSSVDARAWAKAFFHWYNHEHYHSALGLLTPSSVHHGQVATTLAARQAVLTAAYQAHPERFVRSQPCQASPPAAVWINPPREQTASLPAVFSPTPERAGPDQAAGAAASRGFTGQRPLSVCREDAR